MKLNFTTTGAKIAFSLFLLSGTFSAVNAQNVGINETGAAPNASAMLDVNSTTKGLLAPRMTQAERNLIASPATGLLIFQTNNNSGFYYYNGTTWAPVGDGDDNSAGGTVTSVATGAGLTGGPITETGTISLANTSVTAGSYGSATQVGTFTVDAKGRLTSAGNTTIAGVAPGGSAGGDLTGTYPNPTIAAGAVTNAKLANMAANTVKVNATNAAAAPTDFAVPINTVLGRQAGNIVAAQLATVQIANDAVTYAKMQNVSINNRLLGRATAGAGDPEEITLGAGLSISGTTLNTVNNGTVTSVTADNGLTSSGGTTPNITLGGALNTNTSISQGNFNMVYNLNGTGDFEVRDNGVSAFSVKDDGTIGINTNSPDATAIMDIVSTGKGLLIPRMTFAERNAIPSPANSLIIFNTTSNCLEIYANGAWQSFYCSCPVLDPLQPITGPTPVCHNTTVSYSVQGVTGATTYTWTVTGVAPGSITGNGSTTISFPAPNGLSTFTVTVVAANACATSTVTRSTTVNAYTGVPATPVFATSPVGLCVGGSYNYSIVNGLGGNGTGAITYTWSVTATGSASALLTANGQVAVAGTPAVFTGVGTTISLSNIISAGNITVSVVGDNTCGSSVTPLSLTRTVDQFTTSDAGPDQTVCGNSVTLAGNTPVTGGGMWTLVSGTGTITTPTSPTSTVTGLGLTAVTLRWTLPNGTCADSQDDVIITRNDFTTAAAGADQAVCATTATLAGNTPATGAGTWTLIGGAGIITNAALPNSGVTGLGVGANTFRWTLLNGVCADSQDDVVITRDLLTTSAAGPDQTICATSATLAGNAPVSGTGAWTVVSGTGTFTDASSPTSDVTGLALGANTFRWTLTNGSCATSQDDVIITRNDFTTANAGPDQSVCATTATLAGNTPLSGTGTWSLVSGAGTVTTPTSPTSSITGLGMGANTFRWTLPNGACADSQDDVVITGLSASVAPTSITGTTTICNGTPTTLTAAGGTLGTSAQYEWGTGAVVGTSPIAGETGVTLTVSPIATTTYWVRIVNTTSPCTPNTGGVTRVVTVDQFTTSNAGTDQTVCATSATLAGNVPTTGGGTWTLVGGTGTITANTTANSGVTALGVGANTFRWTLANGACNDSPDDVVITRISPSVAPTSITGTTTICNGNSTTLTATGGTLGTGAQYEWGTGAVVGTSPIAGQTANTLSVNPSANTTYWVRIVNTTSPCTPTTGGVTVTVTVDQFTLANAGPDQIVCATTATLAGNVPTTGGGTWTLQGGSGSITANTTANSGVTALGVGANTFRWTLANGACNDSPDDVVITRISPSVAPTSITGTTTICNGTSTTLTATGGTLGTGAQYEWGTGAVIGTSPIAGQTANTLIVNPSATTTYWVRIVNTTSPCTPNTGGVTVTVTVDQFTTATAGSDQTLCATTATLAGNVPTTGGGIWSLTGGTGSITANTTANSGVTALGVGANTFRWTLANGACADSWDEVIITGQSSSVAPTGISGTLSIALGGSTTLTVNGGSLGTAAQAVWYTGSCGGTQVGTGNSITVSPGSTTQYWVRYVGTCNTTDCATATVTVVTCTPSASGSVSYNATNTSSATQNYATSTVNLCAGSKLSIGCLLGNSYYGDPLIRLYYGATQVTANDDYCGLNSQMDYTVPAGQGGTYTIRLGCYSGGGCGANYNYTIIP